MRRERPVEKVGQDDGVVACPAPMPPRLAANLPGSSWSTSLTPSVAAVEPVKKTFTPSAASTPLVSLAKANSRSAESLVMFSLPAGRDLGRDAVDGVQRRRQVGQGRVACPRPFRSTATSVVCVTPVCVLFTRIWNEPLTGVNAKPGRVQAAGPRASTADLRWSTAESR